MADDLVVTRSWTIPAAELSERFSRSSGPGGQGVNTADSRVELSVDLAGSASMPAYLQERVLERLADAARRRGAHGDARASTAPSSPTGARPASGWPGSCATRPHRLRRHGDRRSRAGAPRRGGSRRRSDGARPSAGGREVRLTYSSCGCRPGSGGRGVRGGRTTGRCLGRASSSASRRGSSVDGDVGTAAPGCTWGRSAAGLGIVRVERARCGRSRSAWPGGDSRDARRSGRAGP